MKHVLDFLFPEMKDGNYTALIVIVCITFALWLLTAVARWRTYNKMGVAGWKAFIPLYGYFVLFDKCWDRSHAWDYILTTIIYAFFEAGIYKGSTDLAVHLCSVGQLIITLNLLYLTVRINFRMSKAFGHGFLFGLGLWFMPFIFTFILAFGKSEYSGNPSLNKKAHRA